MLTKIESDGADRHSKRTIDVGMECRDGSIIEMIYDPVKRQTSFAVWDGTSLRYEREVKLDESHVLLPYSPENNLSRNQVVLFPSEATEYGTQEELVGDIRAFI